MMEVVAGDTFDPSIETEFMEVIRRADLAVSAPVCLEKFEFYRRSQSAYALLMTGERRLYANIILKKGVIR